jgi:VCBS repeat-containing protein
MANDSTHAGQVSSEQDTAPSDSYFTDMQGEDAFFGPEQLAQAQKTVPVPPDQNVIRVQVNPGEIIELSPPFNPDANLLAREADGNLAIKVGDVTVILIGFVDANTAAPIVVETSDGQPIDIATLLASTDPTIDIQTAAGPGDAAGAQGQGADNTGAFFGQAGLGGGLGGLNAVGAQDQTQLSYGLIDNSILKEFQDTPGLLSSSSTFGGMQEPFLRDPAHYLDLEPGWNNFSDFYNAYAADLTALQGQTPFPGGWADHKGTEVDPSQTVDDFIAKTTQTITVSHSSSDPEALVFNPMDFFDGVPPTSDGKTLEVRVLMGDPHTVFLVRPDDNGHEAIIMVFHWTDSGPTTGDFHVQAFLINRLDHPGHEDPNDPGSDSFRDVLAIEFHTYVQPFINGEEPSQEILPGEHGSVDILDDTPIAYDVVYKSFLGEDAPCDTDSEAALAGKKEHDSVETTDKGFVDEDWLHGSKWDHNQGNKDQDNDPPGSNKDEDRGDDIGRTTVTGNLNIDFGADGAAGAGNNDCLIVKNGLALALEHIPETYNASNPTNEPFKDANGNVLTSNGHDLYVIEHYTDNHGVEHLVVGYVIEKPESERESIFGASDGLALSGESESDCAVKVFELKLNVDPNDDSGFEFQDFKFELFKGIDQLNNPGDPVETNTLLKFDVIGHDDDGDAVHTAINIQVNDDAPMLADTCYLSFKGGIEEVTPVGAFAMLASGFDLSGLGLGNQLLFSKEFGSTDEDWLIGAGNNDTDGTGKSNAQQNGDEYGTTFVFGLLNVDFGGDGPKEENAYSLTTFKVGDTFEDAEHETYKTDGNLLKVLTSDEGHLVVGYNDGTTDIKIFELTVSNDPGGYLFGGFGFVLHGPIDHTGQNEQTLDIKFDVKATDADDDSVTAQINIHVNDDKPEVGVTYYNNLEHDFLNHDDTGTLTGLSVVGPKDTVKTTDYGHVDEDWLKGGATATYTGNQDQKDNAGLYGDDIGKTEVCGQINVKYGGDGPAGTDAPFALHTYTDGEVFKDGDGTGNSFKSDGKDLVVLDFDATTGHLLVGLPGQVVDIGDGFTSITPETKIFELDFDAGTGKFDFKLWGPIDHVPQAGPDGDETNTLVTFKVGAATDKDGDTADAVIKIQVNDDKPEVPVLYTNQSETAGTILYQFDSDYGRVDEDWAYQSPGNKDTDGTSGDTYGLGTFFFKLGTVNFGGDGPGAGGGAKGFDAQENDTITAKDDNGDPQTVKTSDGHTVLVHLDPPSSGFHLLTGYFNSDDSVGYVDGVSVKVFTLAYNESTADGQFNLDRSLEHPIANTEDNLLLTFGIKTGQTDNDGDPVVALIKINVNDDAPLAVDDCEDLGTTSGNVITNDAVAGTDKPGADGAKVTGALSVTAGGTEETADTDGNTTVAGALGLLVIAANGDWTYTLYDENTKGSDVFEYRLTDGDGDSDTAQLIVTTAINDDSTDLVGLTSFKEVGPTHEPASKYDHDVDVTGLNGIANPFTSQTFHFEDATGGHVISGGAGNDYINVTGSTGAVLTGNGGDDIIHAGDGKSVLNGGGGDDTLFGGNNDDSFFGGAGHDAMSGGGGNDTFSKVDADDLDGTNTLDGKHSIDGGDGYDTVDVSGLKTFTSDQAMTLENIEHLAFDGKAAGGGGTLVTLSYDAAYGVTQVGGLHTLSITGDKADTVHLTAGSGGQLWSDIGNHQYEAGVGASKVTLTVEAGVNVDLS